MNVAILGASAKPDRYAYKAQEMLIEHGHETFPISLNGDEILGRPGFTSIGEIPETSPIDTLTLYLGPARLDPLIDEIIAAYPRRIIFNPGTESAEASARFKEAGIDVLEACTLILLGTGQFE